jgi:Mg2+ and Co2+ transporter CorA
MKRFYMTTSGSPFESGSDSNSVYNQDTLEQDAEARTTEDSENSYVDQQADQRQSIQDSAIQPAGSETAIPPISNQEAMVAQVLRRTKRNQKQVEKILNAVELLPKHVKNVAKMAAQINAMQAYAKDVQRQFAQIRRQLSSIEKLQKRQLQKSSRKSPALKTKKKSKKGSRRR